MTRILTFVVSAILIPSLAVAECVQIPLRDLVTPAAVVFSGTSTHIVTNTASEWPSTIVAFDVERVWKGSVTRRFAVYSFTRTVEGMRFRAGKTYLVFAHDARTQERDDLRLTAPTQAVVVGQCGDGTKESWSALDLAELGPRSAPIP